MDEPQPDLDVETSRPDWRIGQETWADLYRNRNGLAPDAPVTVMLGGDPRTAYVYLEGAWQFYDGGTLDVGIFAHGPKRWAYLARRVRRWPCRAWGWVRFGWRD